MPATRPWLVIPAIAVIAGVIAGAMARSAEVAIAATLLGAALAAAVRAFVGAGALGSVAAATGAMLGVLGWLALGDHVAPTARGAIAGAAAMFAVCELVRSRALDVVVASPWPAVGASLVAGVLDPAYAALLVVAAMNAMAAPRSRSRWMIALPIVGGALVVVAVLAALGHMTALARAWNGPANHASWLATLRMIGDGLGPIAAIAALAGIAQCASRDRIAASAMLGIVALTALFALAGARVTPAVPIVAGLAAGVALGRLASLVRLPIGQAFVGAAAGFVLVVVPAWPLIASP